MRRISSRVQVSNMRYKIGDGLLWTLADRLAPILKILVKEEHLSGKKINTRPLPQYSAWYQKYKAHVLGIQESQVSPNLELSGELHDGAITQTAHQIGFAIARYLISTEGAANLLAAQLGSNKIWEAFDRIGQANWDNYIIPLIAEEMDSYHEHFDFLVSIPPK